MQTIHDNRIVTAGFAGELRGSPRWTPAFRSAVRRLVRERHFVQAMVFSVIAIWPTASLHAQDTIYSAERVKAAFLYHFSTYVDWPESGEADGKFTIAILGAEPVAAELEQFLPGHTIQGRPMNVHRLRTIDDLDSEEVLFIGADENEKLERYLDEVESRPVLVVTDVPQGLRAGAIINFRVVESRVRFEISLRTAEGVGLELSSRLLSAAMFVDTAGAIVDIPSIAVAAASYGAAHR